MLETVARPCEAGLEVSLDRRAVLDRRSAGGLHVVHHLLRASPSLFEERDDLLLDRFEVGAGRDFGAQLLAPRPELVLPGLDGSADGRGPGLRLGSRRAGATPTAA